MNLEQFVKETLLQVVNGVARAQKEIESGDLNAVICPDRYQNPRESPISFDVAVTVETSGEFEAKAGIKVLAVAGGKLEGTNITLSRVSFSVPVVLPLSQRDPRVQQ